MPYRRITAIVAAISMNVSAAIEDLPPQQGVMNNAGYRVPRPSLEPSDIAGALFPF
jgi:hypothetical protein